MKGYLYQTHSNESSNEINDVIDDVEHDGRVLTSSRDPPGQRSVYILPGNKEDERYRSTTFTKFPRQSSVDVIKLAENGFCFTGYKDRVKCFSCGVSVEEWQSDDDPSSIRWHFTYCEFYTRVPDRNIPKKSRFNFLGSSSLQSSSGVRNNASSTSGIRTSPEPTPISTHSVMSPSSQRQTLLESNEVQISSVLTPSIPAGVVLMSHGSHQDRTNNQDSLQQRQITFPCRLPINPHMRSIEARIATFDAGWNTETLQASVRELAEAGLFYLGTRDKMKCWYCNGGLQNWDYEDSPWFEHAKWFPRCEYLLQMKGFSFVESIVSQFPGLRRPAIRNPYRQQAVSGLQPQTQARDGSLGIIDPREEMRKLEMKVEAELEKSSSIVETAHEMGFSMQQIKNAFKRQLISTNQSFSGRGDLVASLVNHESDDDQEVESTPEETKSTPETSLSARDEINRLEQEKLCKICHRSEIQVVFLPCGHLVSCNNCSPSVSVCPLCKVPISEKIRTFAS